MNESIPFHLAADYRLCEKNAFNHYENFPVASLLLSKESRPHVAALYAFARTADDFADEDRFEGRRLKELNRWEKGLRDAVKNKKKSSIFQDFAAVSSVKGGAYAREGILRAFAHTLKAFQIPLSLPLALLKAFRMDVTIHRYADWTSLLNYCRHSANPVGRMVLLISGIREERLHRYSDFICGGLQLINFWQDTSIDLRRGRVYYPKNLWKKAGIKETDLIPPWDSPAVRRLVKNAVDYTEAYFRRGYPLLSSVPGRLGLELKATYLGGLGILQKIRGMDYNVLKNRPVLNKWDKTLLALKALAGWVKP